MEEVINQQVAPQPQQPTHSSGMLRMAIIAGVILLMALIGIGGYVLGTRNISTTKMNEFVTKAEPTTLPESPTGTSEPTNTLMPGWKSYTSTEGGYMFQYPTDWVVEVYKEKYPYNTSSEKGYTVFQTRATTAQKKAAGAPDLPVDMGTGSIKIITTNAMRGQEYAKISNQEFFNSQSNFWPKGNAGGGGPGTTYSVPQEVSVGGKRAMKQSSHPTISYEWSSRNQITTTYYVWLGNAANEVVEVSFTFDDNNPNKTRLETNFEKLISSFKLE